jgi:hypothetical protein
LPIARLPFAALTDPAAVVTHRAGALERVALLLGDWLETHRRLLDTETRMTAVLDELRLTELVTSITGLSAIGAAAILRRGWIPGEIRPHPMLTVVRLPQGIPSPTVDCGQRDCRRRCDRQASTRRGIVSFLPD